MLSKYENNRPVDGIDSIFLKRQEIHGYCTRPVGWLYLYSSGESIMMTSSNGNIFRVTGHLCGEFTGPRWFPPTKASDAELWCFLWSAAE